MKSRLFAVLMALLLAAFVPGAAAQEAPTIPCGSLSAEDCNVLTTAFNNMAQLKSGTFTLDGFIEILSNDASQAGKITITVDGRFNGIPALAVNNSMTAVTDPSALVAETVAALDGVSGEYNINLELPPQAAAMSGGVAGLDVQLRLVDSIIYLNLDALATSLGPIAASLQMGKGWGGLNLAEGLTMMGAMASSFSQGGASTGITSGNATDRIQQAASKYVTITQNGDTFYLSYDIPQLLADSEVQAALQERWNSMPDRQRQSLISALTDMKFDITLKLNTANQIGEANLIVSIPESSLEAMSERGGGSIPTGVNIEFKLTYADLGVSQTIEAPAGATITPVNDLMQGIFGMMGSMSG